MSENKPPVGRSSPGDRLRSKQDLVILRWEARLREEVPAATRESRAILIDTLPAILDQLAQALTPEEPRYQGPHSSSAASEHGGERVRLTHFRLEDLIAEYRLLRQILFEVLEEDGPLQAEARNRLNAALDQTIIDACTGYALVQSSLRDQVFAILAHDLRNPLNAAQTGAHLILVNPTAEDVPRVAARIIHNIRRADRMVQDILDTVQVQTGALLQLNIQECDLAEIARETLEQLRAEYGDRFVLKAPAPVRGHFAPDGLRRALENLATNAVKYGEGSRPITITVSEAHERALLTVHNHGAHIPAEDRESLFLAFQRTSTSRTSGKRGWGLGLAQARAIAEAHGGSIAVDSGPGIGTTFIIDIPVDARPFQQTKITPPTA